MKPTTAVALILLSLSLVFTQRRAGLSLDSAPIALAAVTLVG